MQVQRPDQPNVSSQPSFTLTAVPGGNTPLETDVNVWGMTRGTLTMGEVRRGGSDKTVLMKLISISTPDADGQNGSEMDQFSQSE